MLFIVQSLQETGTLTVFVPASSSFFERNRFRGCRSPTISLYGYKTFYRLIWCKMVYKMILKELVEEIPFQVMQVASFLALALH